MNDHLKRIEQDCYDKLDLIAEVRQLRVRNMELEMIVEEREKAIKDMFDSSQRASVQFLEILVNPNRPKVTI